MPNWKRDQKSTSRSQTTDHHLQSPLPSARSRASYDDTPRNRPTRHLPKSFITEVAQGEVENIDSGGSALLHWSSVVKQPNAEQDTFSSSGSFPAAACKETLCIPLSNYDTQAHDRPSVTPFSGAGLAGGWSAAPHDVRNTHEGDDAPAAR